MLKLKFFFFTNFSNIDFLVGSNWSFRSLDLISIPSSDWPATAGPVTYVISSFSVGLQIGLRDYTNMFLISNAIFRNTFSNTFSSFPNISSLQNRNCLKTILRCSCLQRDSYCEKVLLVGNVNGILEIIAKNKTIYILINIFKLNQKKKHCLWPTRVKAKILIHKE